MDSSPFGDPGRDSGESRPQQVDWSAAAGAEPTPLLPIAPQVLLKAFLMRPPRMNTMMTMTRGDAGDEQAVLDGGRAVLVTLGK